MSERGSMKFLKKLKTLPSKDLENLKIGMSKKLNRITVKKTTNKKKLTDVRNCNFSEGFFII